MKSGPFKGLDVTKLPLASSQVIFAANYDFQRVLEKKEPAYAVADGSPFTGGGTQVFKGFGYKLIRYSSLTTIAGVTILFDKKHATGNNDKFA